MKLKTTVIQARAGSASLKTTVPSDLADSLKLKHGDILEWEPLSPDAKQATASGDKLVVTVNLTRAKSQVQPKVKTVQPSAVIVYQEPVAPAKVRSKWAGLD